MKNNRLIYKSGIFLLFAFLSTQFVFAQDSGNETKIHPAFRRMLAQQNFTSSTTLKDNIGTNSSHVNFAITPTQGFASQGAALESRYDCIVFTTNPQALLNSGIIINSILPTFVTAWVTAKQIEQMSNMAAVTFIDAPKTRHIHNDVARGNTGASLLGAGALNNTKYTGKGVIFGILDTGIDWSQLDFRDPVDTTKSRILKIWDQTITAITGEAPPTGFTYGVEYSQAQINNELHGTPPKFVREKDVEGHGTHVAGTAAGNGSALASKKYMGMAPEADIVLIKGGNGSFSSSHIIDGISYLQKLATSLGKPVVLNMSIGGQGSGHDGTESDELAVDNFTNSAAGRVVVISAGNDNGKTLHKQQSLAANSNSAFAIVAPSSTNSTDVFDYLVYANNNSAVTATITAPDGTTLSVPASKSDSVYAINKTFVVYVDNFVDKNNNNRYVEIAVAKNGNNTGNPQGTWTISFANNTANALTLNGWLDDTGDQNTAAMLTGGDNNYLVGSPGNATSAITVGAFVGKISWYAGGAKGAYGYSDTLTTENDSIAAFSSHGPRRDNVLKPEITAQGQAVVSCLSSTAGISATSPSVVVPGLYIVNQGTSMSSPVVAGCVALLLQANPTATAAAIKKSIISTATSDALTIQGGTMPNTTWGYGKIDVFKAASALFINCVQANRKTYQYDNSFTSKQNFGVLFTSQKLAERFTTDIAGKLGGVFFTTAATSIVTSLAIEVRTSNAGNPGTLLGTMNIPAANIGLNSFNYFDLNSLNIPLANATDYFIVIGRNVDSINGSWTMTRGNSAIFNRTLYSTDGGANWVKIGFDYRIRPVVYSTGQLSGSIATTTSTDTHDVNSSNQFFNSNCELIATASPNGLTTTALTGSTTAKVTLETAPIISGTNVFASRHYDITPATNAATATAKTTLYFTQAEMDAYNGIANHGHNLPTGPTDNTGISYVRIAQYHGTSASGQPTGYTGTSLIITPAVTDIIWNSTNQRWEISFNVTGFSGFYLQSLPNAATTGISGSLYPTFLAQGGNVTVAFNGASGNLTIFDAIGRLVYTHTLIQGNQTVYLPLFISGAYFYTINDGSSKVSQGKLIVK